MPRYVVLDTNVAILLTVGATDVSLIKRHKRLGRYDEIDFRILDEAITASAGLVWCAHVLSETSTMVADIHTDARPGIRQTFRQLIDAWPENPVTSRDGARRREYLYLGLTDGVLLHLAEQGMIVITADGPLHDAIQRAGFESVQFQSLRDERRPIHLQD